MRRKKRNRWLLILLALALILISSVGGCSEKVDIVKLEVDMRAYITQECSEGRCASDFYMKWLGARLQETRCWSIQDDAESNTCQAKAKAKRQRVMKSANCTLALNDALICKIPRPTFSGYNLLEDE